MNKVIVAAILITGMVSASGEDNEKSKVKFGYGVKGSAGVLGAGKSADGSTSGSVGPVVFSSNPKTGEKCWGVGTPVGSLQLCGKGTDGKNNAVKVTVGAPTPVSPTGSVKVSTPCFTRSGMTTGSVKNFDPPRGAGR